MRGSGEGVVKSDHGNGVKRGEWKWYGEEW